MSVTAIPEYRMALRSTAAVSRTALWFAFGLVLTAVLMVAFYPTVRDNSEDLESAYSGLPEGLLEAFGIEGGLSLSEYSNFMNIEMLGLIFPIAVAVFAIMQGAGTVAEEVETGTVSLWLSIPVERWRLLLGKSIALIVAGGFISAVTALTVWFGSVLVDGDVAAGGALALFVVLLGFTLAVGGIAVLSSSFANSRGRAGAIAAAVVLAGYILSIVASLSQSFDWVRFLSIFTAYKPLPAMQDASVPAATLALYAVGLACGAAGLLIFQRRDIVI